MVQYEKQLLCILSILLAEYAVVQTQAVVLKLMCTDIHKTKTLTKYRIINIGNLPKNLECHLRAIPST